jgi:hypothetical protein
MLFSYFDGLSPQGCAPGVSGAKHASAAKDLIACCKAVPSSRASYGAGIVLRGPKYAPDDGCNCTHGIPKPEQIRIYFKFVEVSLSIPTGQYQIN